MGIIRKVCRFTSFLRKKPFGRLGFMRSDATLVRTSRSFLVPRMCVRCIFGKRIFASPVHEVFSAGKLKSERTHPERPKQGFTSGLWQMPSPASFQAFPNLYQRKPGVLLANGFLNRLRHQPTNQLSKVTRQVMTRPSPPKHMVFFTTSVRKSNWLVKWLS